MEKLYQSFRIYLISEDLDYMYPEVVAKLRRIWLDSVVETDKCN